LREQESRYQQQRQGIHSVTVIFRGLDLTICSSGFVTLSGCDSPLSDSMGDFVTTTVRLALMVMVKAGRVCAIEAAGSSVNAFMQPSFYVQREVI
jgi:hypothetical protein